MSNPRPSTADLPAVAAHWEPLAGPPGHWRIECGVETCRKMLGLVHPTEHTFAQLVNRPRFVRLGVSLRDFAPIWNYLHLHIPYAEWEYNIVPGKSFAVLRPVGDARIGEDGFRRVKRGGRGRPTNIAAVAFACDDLSPGIHLADIPAANRAKSGHRRLPLGPNLLTIECNNRECLRKNVVDILADLLIATDTQAKETLVLNRDYPGLA